MILGQTELCTHGQVVGLGRHLTVDLRGADSIASLVADLRMFGNRLGRQVVVPDERTRVLGLQGPRRRKATAPEDASHLALQDSAGYKTGRNQLRNATAAALLHHRSVAVVTCFSGVALQLQC